MALAENLAAGLVGALTYWGFFHHGEHFLFPFRYVQMLGIIVLSSSIVLSGHLEITIPEALPISLWYAGIAILSIFVNCFFYRAFLNPLNKFPGPWWARITKFNHSVRIRHMTANIQALKDHEKWGDFVRIGPNDLSVTDARGVEVISAANSKCSKSTWYDHDAPRFSLHTTRSRASHDRRRRIWAPAFSDKALRGYENRVQVFNDTMVEKLIESKGEPVDATKMVNLYSFDTMGDLAFSKDYGALATGKHNDAIQVLNDGMAPLCFQLPSWFFRTLTAIPGLARGYWKFVGFCRQELEDRMARHGKTDPERPDIMQVLIQHYNDSDNKKELWPLLYGDSPLIIIAGSDTTAAGLSYLFYHIASKKEWQQKLREEIEQIKREHNSIDKVVPDTWLKDAPVLNGMINEALRLNPPVPSGVFRKTPPQGVMIGETFIPGNTTIQMPTYVMSRSEDNYVKPLEFIPERWSSKAELIKDKDAFSVFSSGPFGCIGKNLAYMEMRTFTSQIVTQFDVSLAPGEDGHRLLYETHDHFTLGCMPLMLQFKKREV